MERIPNPQIKINEKKNYSETDMKRINAVNNIEFETVIIEEENHYSVKILIKEKK